MNPDLAYLIGALRDGSVYYYKRNRSYYVLYYQKYQSWLEDSIGRRIKLLFDINYKIDEYKKDHFRLRISNRKLYYLIKDGFEFPEEGETQFNWLVPKKLLQGTKEEKASYIRGFFDTEGDVSPNTSSSKYIGISQKNVGVVKQLKQLMSELGIKTTKEHIIDKKSSTYRICVVGRENIRKFNSIIGSEHPIKRKKILSILN